MVVIVSFFSRASWIQWRSPSLGVSGREASWDQVWVACCVRLSIICPPIPPSVPLVFVPTPVLLSLPLSLPPCPLSVFTSPSAPISIPPFLPPCRPPLFVPQSLPHYRRLFLCPCHFPISGCLLTLSLSLSVPSSLVFSFSPSLTQLPTRCSLSLLNKLTNDISLAHCISLVCFWFFFCQDNCPYLNSFFRDMMRQMVKQMRAGREWRAASQDGSNTIVFVVEYLQHQVNNNLTCLTLKQK